MRPRPSLHPPALAAALALAAVLAGPPARADEARPWLGIAIERGAHGVLVKDVLPGSPCEDLVRPGEEVTVAGGQPVQQPEALINTVQTQPIGSRFPLTVRGPDGKERKLSVTLERKPNLRTVQRDRLLDRAAPDFRPRVISGPKLASLSSLRGQVVLIDFFASWCGPCMAALPEIKALHERYGARGLRVIGLSNEPEELVAAVVREHQLPYTVALDPDQRAWRLYWITALPTVAVIDRAGVVRLITVGDLDAAQRLIEGALAAPGKAP